MVQKKISLLEFESNPNIGLYMFVNNKFCLVGSQINEDKKKEIEKVLKVPVYKITMLGTELVGVFASGNDDLLLIPEIYDYELKEIEKICKKNKVNILSINEKQNTFGNNICFGNDKIIINPNYSTEFNKEIEKNTGLKIIKLKNDQFASIGSICRFLNGKFFLSQEIKESEVKTFVKNVGGIGTVNSGSNMISSGVVGNDNGLLLGSMCSTIEIQNITEALDYT